MRANLTAANIKGISVVLLCFAAGTTDVLSYLTLGQVFTSAMTGCAALLFLKLAGGHYAMVARAAIALASYLAGCCLATLLQPRDKTRIGAPQALRRLSLAECLLLLLYVPLALTGAGEDRTYVLIFLSATAMGVQSLVARDLQEPGISTVVLNPTMTSVGVAVAKLVLRREAALLRENKLQLLVLAAYAGGALVTALGLLRHIEEMILLPLGAAGSVLLLFHYLCLQDQERKPERSMRSSHDR
jgi:uncharacterized membrane protein YoaK (UPF0700 family)